MVFHLGYIDPGSGSILVQVIIGGFAGSAFVLRKWIAKLVGLVYRPRKRTNSGSRAAQPQANTEA